MPSTHHLWFEDASGVAGDDPAADGPTVSSTRSRRTLMSARSSELRRVLFEDIARHELLAFDFALSITPTRASNSSLVT
jgi:hypothetical protein